MVGTPAWQNNLMILASAGSGKTYRLVNRVIALVARGADPAEIVALTFTRKAAGEFADAVLMRLASAASDETTADQLRADIGVADADFSLLLENVVRALPRFTLGTIDGFFTRVVKAFQYDLGLSGGAFDLVEGPRALVMMDRMLGQALAGWSEESANTEFINAFRRATMGRELAGLLRPLRGYIDQWHDKYLESSNAEWGPAALHTVELEEWEKSKHALAKRVRNGLGDIIWSEKRQPAALEKLIDSLELHTIGSGSISLTGSLGKSLLAGLTETTDGPMDLSHYKPFTLPASMANALRAMLRLCAECETASAVRRTRAIHHVIRAYDGLCGRHLRGKGLLGFRDVKLLMGRWAHDEDARLRREAVDFRLDARYHHWLLDEFQDTSRADWAGLSPLVEEAVTSDEGSLFLVGDKKQAIYGWRGGDVRLFDEIHDRYAGNMHQATMAESWRSCPQVLALVNRVCGDSSALQSLFGPVADRWDWEPHVSAARLQAPGKSGEARVEVVGDWDERQQRTLDILQQLGVGQKQMTCGVLLRDNKKAREMADFLRSHHFDVVLDGSRTPATDTPVGWLVFQTLRWLANPDDSFAREVIAMSPAGRAEWQQHASSWDALWLDLSDRIARSGFADALRSWLAPHAATWSDFGQRRADDLLGALQSMDRQGIVSAREAADWLERVEVAQGPGAAEVQVMTIHKSKGLGFDVVIVPEVSNDSIPEAQRFDIAEADGWILETPPQWVRAIIPALSQAEETWSQKQRYEAFCMLYVALTRAKRGLYVLLDPPAEKSDPHKPSLANWLRHTIDGESDGILFQSGSPDWPHTLPPIPPEPPRESHITLGPAVTRRAHISPSALKNSQQPASTRSPGGLAFGREAHELLEKLRWLDDGSPPSLPDTPAGDAVRALLAEPALADLFHRNGRPIDLLLEQPIDAFLDGFRLSGVIDRLHLHRDESHTVRHVDVIDWKSDAVASPADLTDRYTAQMNAYRRALQTSYPDAQIECLLVSLPHRCIQHIAL
jgi:ATP-dependent exoDNAse (exonuclease V) beta subunit